MSADRSSARLPLLVDDVLDPTAAVIFAEVAGDGAVVPELYRVLAHAPAQLQAWHGLAAEMRRPSGLPASVEVAVVLRVAYLMGSDRQWRHQAGRADAAGLTASQLEAIRTDDPCASGSFDGAQIAALSLATEIALSEPVTDETFADAIEHLGTEGLIAVAMKATYFRSLAGLLSVFGMT